MEVHPCFILFILWYSVDLYWIDSFRTPFYRAGESKSSLDHGWNRSATISKARWSKLLANVSRYVKDSQKISLHLTKHSNIMFQIASNHVNRRNLKCLNLQYFSTALLFLKLPRTRLYVFKIYGSSSFYLARTSYLIIFTMTATEKPVDGKMHYNKRRW